MQWKGNALLASLDVTSIPKTYAFKIAALINSQHNTQVDWLFWGRTKYFPQHITSFTKLLVISHPSEKTTPSRVNYRHFLSPVWILVTWRLERLVLSCWAVLLVFIYPLLYPSCLSYNNTFNSLLLSSLELICTFIHLLIKSPTHFSHRGIYSSAPVSLSEHTLPEWD